MCVPVSTPAQVGQELEAEVGLVVERAQHGRDLAGAMPDLGLVVALADGHRAGTSPNRASSRRLSARSMAASPTTWSGTFGPTAAPASARGGP